MMHQAYAVQAPPNVAATGLHVPDVVRAVMLLVAVGALANFTLLNEHVIFGPVAWAAFFGYAALSIAAAVRIILLEAIGLREPNQRMERTRLSGSVMEVVLAGTGALMLLAPIAYLIIGTSQEMWAGRVEESSFSLASLLLTVPFGVGGFFMVFWRPQFVLDVAARTITRYAFGRSIPLRVAQMSYAELAVYSVGYFITNTGTRLGDMIRGCVGKYTFELEMLHGSHGPELVQQRAMGWAYALGARYWAPEQAAAAELA